MDTKLTLNMDREIARKAKEYARSKGRSLSGLLEDYLKFILSSNPSEEIPLSPKIRALKGSMKFPETGDYKTLLSEEINRKHNKR